MRKLRRVIGGIGVPAVITCHPSAMGRQVFSQSEADLTGSHKSSFQGHHSFMKFDHDVMLSVPGERFKIFASVQFPEGIPSIPLSLAPPSIAVKKNIIFLP
ncbi:hypothetical protein ACRQ5I_07285 [Pseudoramibacter alactolyticus]|uniref:hypothetical protein n=1 Tax=Pseudoramibacter alactolyticus TaxID=113287 RepID=UPI003D7FE6B0